MKTIDAITKELRGQVCWGVQWSHNNNLSISFGEPYLRILEPHVFTKPKMGTIGEFGTRRIVTVKGKLWLWFQCAYWKLTVGDSLTATISSSLRRKNMAMARLNSQKLTEIRVNPETGATEFTFDLGGSLQVRRSTKKDSDPIWTLYNYNNGFVLEVRRDGTFTYCRGTTPFDKMKPRRIKVS